MWVPICWMGPFHLQTTNGPKKFKCLNFIHEVREKKIMHLDFGRTAPRYFEKEVIAMVKALRCSLRCNCRKIDQWVNSSELTRNKVNSLHKSTGGFQVAIPVFGLGRWTTLCLYSLKWTYCPSISTVVIPVRIHYNSTLLRLQKKIKIKTYPAWFDSTSVTTQLFYVVCF